MVAAITGINLPSMVSESMPNGAIQQQLLKQTSDRSYFRDTIALSISKDASAMLATLKGETLPAVAVELNQQVRNPGGKKQAPYKKKQKPSAANSDSGTNSTDSTDSASSDSADEKTIKELKARDTEVKTHELQHLASAGAYARGGAVYDYQVGPDGKAYAIGGHVDVDTSPVSGNPSATIQKAQVLKQSAMSVADPSAADSSVAIDAAAMQVSAKAEEEEETQEKTQKVTAYRSSLLESYNSLSYRISPGYMVNAVA